METFGGTIDERELGPFCQARRRDAPSAPRRFDKTHLHPILALLKMVRNVALQMRES